VTQIVLGGQSSLLALQDPLPPPTTATTISFDAINYYVIGRVLSPGRMYYGIQLTWQ
jgi:hypothetical protein